MYIGLVAVFGLLLSAAGAVDKTAIDSQRVKMLQISIVDSTATPAEIRRALGEESAKIKSCQEGLELGKYLKDRGLHGLLKVNLVNAPLSALPTSLRESLISRAVGRATPVFGGQNAFRVLIRCEANFALPKQEPSASAEQR